MATAIGNGNGNKGNDTNALPRFKIVRCSKRNSDFYEAPPEKKKKKEKKKKGRDANSVSYDDQFIKLHFFPNGATSFDNFLHPFTVQRGEDVCFEIEKPRYPPEIQRTPPSKLEIGKPLEVDISTLLSNPERQRDYLVRYDGTSVDVGSLKGKYLLICCFFIPLVADWEDGQYCRAMIAAYKELSKKKKKKFEMVMVAKMRTDLLVDAEDEEAAFDHFFSAFPCPAIPFADVHSRDLVCHSLGLCGPPSQPKQHAALVLDPHQTVLHTDATLFYDFGAASYPFTAPRIEALKHYDETLKCRLDVVYKCCQADEPVHEDKLLGKCKPLPLNKLLCCKSSLVLSKFGSDSDADNISVSQLSKKRCVALYLCYNGHFLPKLVDTHKWYADKNNLEFEIVLVHLPFSGDPNCFFSAVKLALKDYNVSTWWELPFVDHVSRRLWRLSDQAPDDSVIIWADGGKAGDLMGRGTIRNGFPYPFTRRRILEARLFRFKALTLEPLLGAAGTCSSLVCDDDRIMPSSALEGKNVLLYFDWNDRLSDSFYKLLLNSYQKICEDYPGTQVVFVPVCKNKTSSSTRDVSSSISWPRFSIPATGVFRQLYQGGAEPPALVAIGPDGCIRSRRAFDRLNPYGKVPLFADTFFQEILDELLEDYTLC